MSNASTDGEIVVHDDHVEIHAKSANAVALMASSSALDPEDVDRPEAVLAKGGDLLRLQDSNLRPGG